MNVIAEMESVLREEQELLLAGRLEALEPLVERKSRLVEVLASLKPAVSHEAMLRLVDRANHNEALLAAAQRGLQAAIVQIRQSAEIRNQNIYSRNGERCALSKSPSSITQRS